MTRAAAPGRRASSLLSLLIAAALFAGDPAPVEWNKDTVTPSCAACTAEVPLGCTKCPGCGEAIAWRELAFDPTPAGAFVKLKYALKYHRSDLLKECVTEEIYLQAEAEKFEVSKGPLDDFLHARIKKVNRDGDVARIQFESGEGKKPYVFEARREGDSWRLGPPNGAPGHDIHQNETLARRDLLEIVEAEQRWAEGDLDADGVHDYWTRDVAGLFAHPSAKGEPLRLLRQDLAQADPLGAKHFPSVGTAKATHGYWYAVLRLDRQGRPMQRDVDGDGAPFENAEGFGVCAWPEKYGESGRMTFLVDREGSIWERDLGGAAAGAPPGPAAADLPDDLKAVAEKLLAKLASNQTEARRGAVNGIVDLGPGALPLLRAALDREDLRASRDTIALLVEALVPPPCVVVRWPADPESDGWKQMKVGETPR